MAVAVVNIDHRRHAAPGLSQPLTFVPSSMRRVQLHDVFGAVVKLQGISKERQIYAFRNDFFTVRLTTMTTTVF
ncbi:MAG TPA: hypothetical protein VNF08_01510 [Acidimicrobiales bacterium]|nr:hypothetical protein [Acidimicrobiales bacterium]